MTERLCTFDPASDLSARGKSTPDYVKLYEVWGEGEIGVIVLGNIPIEREGLEARGNMIIDRANVSTVHPCIFFLSNAPKVRLTNTSGNSMYIGLGRSRKPQTRHPRLPLPRLPRNRSTHPRRASNLPRRHSHTNLLVRRAGAADGGDGVWET